MFLSHIQIQRYRALHSVNVDLRDLTVLVGANDSGKSSFLAALRTLFHQGAGGIGVERSDRYRNDERESAPQVLAWRDGQGPLAKISDEWVGLYQLPSAGIPMISGGHAEAERGPFPVLEQDGGGVATLLDSLLRRDRPRFDRIVSALRLLIPGLEDIRIGTPVANTRSLELVIEGGVTIAADRASTGLKMMLFFVALAYHPSPPDLILIEEPENGVHPKRLGEIVRLLRLITLGEPSGHAAQVVLTTHSPYLLDSIDLDRDQVLVFQREEDGRRTVQAANQSRLQRFLREFQLGEVWYNEGERGLIASK